MQATKQKMKDSGIEWIGKIPQDWNVEKLKYASKLRNEKLEKADGLDYIGLENIESGTGKVVASKEIMEPESVINHFHPGDVLFGKLRPYLAKVLPVMKEGVCTSELLVLQPKEVTQRFLSYRLIASDFISLVDNSTYGAKMPRASWDFIGNIPIAHPPKDEQKKVADFLDIKTSTINHAIEQKRKLIDLLKEKRTAIINRAVTRGLDENVELVDSGVEWIGKVPRGWRFERLKFVTDSVSRGESPDYVEDSLTFVINQACIYWEGLRLEGLKFDSRKDISGSKGRLLKGDLLMNSTGTGTLGRLAYFDREGSYMADSHVTIIRTVTKRLNPIFLQYLFGTGVYQGYICASAVTGSTNQIELSRDKLLEVPIILPEVKVQSVIATELKRIDEQIALAIQQINKSIELLTEYRTSLISHVVTGKVEI